MPSVTIRNVPQGTRNELAARAAGSGKSLQEYLRNELIELARRPSPEALVTSIRDRKRRSSTTLTAARILEHRDADRK